MLLDLSKLQGNDEHVERSYAASAFDMRDNDEYALVGNVRLTVDVHKDKDQFRLVGHLDGTLQLVCSRCLEPYPWPVSTDFDLLYLPHAVNRGEGEVEIEEDDLTTAYYRDETIDLGLLIREQFYLALPMKPLCKPDCGGWCPVCGVNRNTGTCTCEATWRDPRLAVLKDLQKKTNK